MFKVFISLVLVLGLFFSCTMGGSQEGIGVVQFGVTEQVSRNVLSGVSSLAKGLIVTIENEYGHKVYTEEYLSLFNMSGHLITTPIDLLVGNYKLTQFLVVDKNGDVIAATPMRGSVLAQAVKAPLAIKFSIKKDEVVKLVPEVISTKECVPADFGYVTFSFTEVKVFPFLIAPFRYNPGLQNFQLTDANLKVKGDDVLVYDWPLDGATNTVLIPKGYSNYTLLVEKPGYVSYHETFTFAELSSYWDTVLEVILYENYTFRIKYNDGAKNVIVKAKQILTDKLITNYYSYGSPYGASYNGDLIPSEEDTILLFIMKDLENKSSLVLVLDKPQDGDGGSVIVSLESTGLIGEDLEFVVKDDPGETDFIWDSSTGSSATPVIFNWAPCCTDGFVLSPIPVWKTISLGADFHSLNGLSVMKVPYINVYNNLEYLEIPFSQINTVEFLF